MASDLGASTGAASCELGRVAVVLPVAWASLQLWLALLMAGFMLTNSAAFCYFGVQTVSYSLCITSLLCEHELNSTLF